MFAFFFFNDTATTEIYTLSLHDALPISAFGARGVAIRGISDTVEEDLPLDFNRVTNASGDVSIPRVMREVRSEEHTSELQSPCNLVCRLLLEKKKKIKHTLCWSDILQAQ